MTTTPSGRPRSSGSEGNAAAKLFWRWAAFRPSDLWWGEWAAVVLGATGGALVATREPGVTNDVVAAASALAGVVIGGVLAGMAILTSGLDTEFLSKLGKSNVQAQMYLSPFLRTSIVSILAEASLFVWAAVASGGPTIMAVFGGLSGALVLWSISTLVPALGTLVYFVGLRQDGAGGN